MFYIAFIPEIFWQYEEWRRFLKGLWKLDCSGSGKVRRKQSENGMGSGLD